VRIDRVTARYTGSQNNAVEEVTLDVRAGELIVLLGPSGSGKSTLLRTINRLVTPAGGTLYVDGRDVLTFDPTLLRRSIGYVVQAVGLFPHMSVAQNIAIVPQLIGWEPARIHRRVDDLLTLVHLDPASYRHRFPRELSGGEAQRVGVARALAAEPRVLLMDEPFGAVDALVRLALQEELRRIHQELGTTIFFVTHDIDEALRMADRIAVVRNGRIEQYDVPLRLLSYPATPYVEELLGSRDALRRLSRLTVQSAIRRSCVEGATAFIQSDCTLRDALNLLLAGSNLVEVRRGDSRIGTVTFDDIRIALAKATG
jgi:osmoprotectant transport system ATP-binding protein